MARKSRSPSFRGNRTETAPSAPRPLAAFSFRSHMILIGGVDLEHESADDRAWSSPRFPAVTWLLHSDNYTKRD